MTRGVVPSRVADRSMELPTTTAMMTLLMMILFWPSWVVEDVPPPLEDASKEFLKLGVKEGE